MLVVAAMLGDLPAFDELCMRYRAAVVRTAYAIVGRADAEDVAQDVLLIAFKALHTLEAPEKFGSWLAVITRRRALRFSRRERPHQDGRVELNEMIIERLAALSKPLIRPEEEDLRQALGHLPDVYSFTLRLHYLDGLSLKRIASFLGVPLSTVKWRLHRGRKLLRAQLEPAREVRVWNGRKNYQS